MANGNVSSEQINRPGFTAYQGFAYDGANRLCSANESASPGNGPANCTATPPGGLNWAQQYVYDPVGNQAVVGTVMPGLTATPMATSVTSTVPFNSQNQYTGASYDNAGNMKSVSAATMQLTYDAEGRMITETDNGASPPVTATFTYDGQGRRVRKATGSGTTYYTYGPMGELISETGGTALPKTTYLTVDHLGSTRLVTNSAAYLGCHDYLPFGQEILASYGTRANSLCYDLPDTDIQFTGQVRDTDTTFSLDYFGARYLSGTMGRFTSADGPFNDQDPSDPQSWNMYSYVRNNPLTSVDPDGTCTVVNGQYQEDGGDPCPPPPGSSITVNGGSSDSVTYSWASLGGRVAKAAANAANSVLIAINDFRNSPGCTGSLVSLGQSIGASTVGAYSAQAGFAAGGLLGLETGPGALATGAGGAALLGTAGAGVGYWAGGGIGGATASVICNKGTGQGGGDYRPKTKGANASDAKTIRDVAREKGIDARKFGKFIEAEKRAEGRGPSDNYSYDELRILADAFKMEGH